MKPFRTSLIASARETPFVTTWPKQFPLRKPWQQLTVSLLERQRVCRIPSLTVSPLGDKEKNSLRKCSTRLSVLIGWPRRTLRESVSTSDPLSLSIQTPRCRVLVNLHVPYMENIAISAYVFRNTTLNSCSRWNDALTPPNDPNLTPPPRPQRCHITTDVRPEYPSDMLGHCLVRCIVHCCDIAIGYSLGIARSSLASLGIVCSDNL